MKSGGLALAVGMMEAQFFQFKRIIEGQNPQVSITHKTSPRILIDVGRTLTPQSLRLTHQPKYHACVSFLCRPFSFNQFHISRHAHGCACQDFTNEFNASVTAMQSAMKLLNRLVSTSGWLS
jgi:hypothetical protein